jgi:hypothetical protein
MLMTREQAILKRPQQFAETTAPVCRTPREG